MKAKGINDCGYEEDLDPMYNEYDSFGKLGDEPLIKTFVGILSKQLLMFAQEMKSIRINKDYDVTPHDNDDDSVNSSESWTGYDKDDCIMKLVDNNGNDHWVKQYSYTTSSKTSKKYCKTRRCKICAKHTSYFCDECKQPFCFGYNGNAAEKKNRRCFYHHVDDIVRKSTRNSK